uniref:FCP1 homology domain-containing protein n=1 Tax=Tetradesmus obliquus TaxID=3088 RepID=A0A383VDZ1_TETOB|eukprot:jgi/Sobl393_1/13089/SZX62942.1
MTEVDIIQPGSAGAGLVCAVQPEQSTSLITSSTRAQKRRPEPVSGQHAVSNKRQKQITQQAAPCASDVSNDDQENQQTVVAPHSVHELAARGPRGSLGTMLAPLYEWLQAGGQQQAAAGQQQQLEQQEQQLAPCPLPLQAQQQPALAGEASASANASGATASGSPSSSSAPTVSQPSSNSAQHAVHSHSHHNPHHHQQFLQQEDQLYHPHGHGHHAPAGAADNNGAPGADAAAAAALQQHRAGATSGGSDESDDADYDDDDFDPLVFIGTLGPVEHYALPGRQPLLPRQTRQCKQKTLVLDLDETLVHSTLDAACGVGADFSFPVTFNGAEHMVHVRQRPHMREFLERVAALFEVVVFTASQKVYAEKLLNILDPQRQLIRHRIYRDSCVLVDGNYLKDLSVLGRDLSRCAIVDNSPQAFGFQVANGIPIESWYDDPEDNELMQLLPFLENISHCSVTDVRPPITARYNLPAKVQEASMRLMNSVAAAAAAHQQQLREREQQQRLHEEQQQQRSLMVQAATTAAVLQPQLAVHQQLQPPVSQPQVQQA